MFALALVLLVCSCGVETREPQIQAATETPPAVQSMEEPSTSTLISHCYQHPQRQMLPPQHSNRLTYLWLWSGHQTTAALQVRQPTAKSLPRYQTKKPGAEPPRAAPITPPAGPPRGSAGIPSAPESTSNTPGGGRRRCACGLDRRRRPLPAAVPVDSAGEAGQNSRTHTAYAAEGSNPSPATKHGRHRRVLRTCRRSILLSLL